MDDEAVRNSPTAKWDPWRFRSDGFRRRLWLGLAIFVVLDLFVWGGWYWLRVRDRGRSKPPIPGYVSPEGRVEAFAEALQRIQCFRAEHGALPLSNEEIDTYRLHMQRKGYPHWGLDWTGMFYARWRSADGQEHFRLELEAPCEPDPRHNHPSIWQDEGFLAAPPPEVELLVAKYARCG